MKEKKNKKIGERVSPLLDNAIDSIALGTKFYVQQDAPNPNKHAIRSLFHGIELLLKERLRRENRILIYKDIDRVITNDSMTVGLKETLARLHNLEIRLDKSHTDDIIALQKKRNRIEHHIYTNEDDDYITIGMALRFAYFFMKNHLEVELSDFIDKGLYKTVREIILKYQERLDEAEKEVEKLTTPTTKDDLYDHPISAICPQCGNQTLVVNGPDEDYCHFCLEQQDVQPCDSCGDYFPPEEITEYGMCESCLEDQMERW